MNGAAARLIHPGDLVIVLSYGLVTDEESPALKPSVVFLDSSNHIVQVGHDPVV